MDRDRLKEVRQTDLTEGRINEDFVDWMKTKGTTWLLVLVIALFAYAAFVKWNHHRMSYRTEAWQELGREQMPSSLEEVAEKYSDVDAVPHLARLTAAKQLLVAVQAGRAISPVTTSPAAPEAALPLTDAERTEYLDRADRLFARVVEDDDGSPARALLVAVSLNGRAAVAESQGKIEEAKAFYAQSASRVESQFPKLAEQTRARAASIEGLETAVQLPTQSELMAALQNRTAPPMLDPVWTEPWVNELLAK